ncbi:hypothetical protein INT48_003904 [Thamnidium elegans]|uniref:MAGE domain-containing protein n=1 Tax=Thamnidium elegans TaxID=101142 RepID=A0A8H7SKM0_9FUNG|nr:hypothetical protein INT48_003904 [Thamnidium elegans]
MKRARLDSDDEFGNSTQTQRQTDASTSASTQLGSINWDEEENQRKIKNVVRYALSHEFNRKLMKREEIMKIINPDNKKISYNAILERVRLKLNHVFGMDLVELPKGKERKNQSQTQMKRSEQTQQAESSTQAAESATQADIERTGTSGTYVLRYNMKKQYRTKEIITQSADEYKQTGILYIILGLIFLNSQSMTSPDLYEHLNRLKVTKTKSEFGDREELLNSFQRNHYLKKSKRPDTSGDEIEYDFTWGPRAKLEIPPQNMVNFLLEVIYIIAI